MMSAGREWISGAEALAIMTLKRRIENPSGLLDAWVNSGDIRMRSPSPVALSEEDLSRPDYLRSSGITWVDNRYDPKHYDEFHSGDLRECLQRLDHGSDKDTGGAPLILEPYREKLIQEIKRKGFPNKKNKDPSWRTKTSAAEWLKDEYDQANPSDEASRPDDSTFRRFVARVIRDLRKT